MNQDYKFTLLISLKKRQQTLNKNKSKKLLWQQKNDKRILKLQHNIKNEDDVE